MFFFSMCGEARQSGSKKGSEGRKGGRWWGGSCSTTPVPPFSAPFSKPPNPAIMQISLCHPWNAGDNHHLSTDTRPLAAHRHGVDPVAHIPSIEGQGGSGRGREKEGGAGGGWRVGAKTCF